MTAFLHPEKNAAPKSKTSTGGFIIPVYVKVKYKVVKERHCDVETGKALSADRARI
jgi:hypothetical protein